MATRATRKRSRRSLCLSLGMLLLMAPFVWVGQSQVKARLREPQAILVLGGSAAREHFAAELARQNPTLPVWVSSGTNPEYAEWLFQQADVALSRVNLDYRAVDTVTNFTTIAADLEASHIRSLYLVTSDYHMRRATIIGQIVLGRYDIAFQPVPVPTGHSQPEPLVRGIRDGGRAILWLLTGHTGASLGKLIKS